MSALSCLRSHTAVVKSPERIRNFGAGVARQKKECAKEAHHKHHEKKHHDKKHRRKHKKHGK
ncbi:hypothetical protein ACQ86D_03940 [Streptomyces galilaeus]